MDNTARMIRLLGRLRREMNGAVVDSMRYYGKEYGLNYGVSIPTIRAIARAEECDDALARYLYVQQVRELRLAALHIADPALLSSDQAGFWAEGIINSEVAEEAAFAFLSRAAALPEIFEAWCDCDANDGGADAAAQSVSHGELLAYAALMAGARARMMQRMPGAGASAVRAVTCYPESHIVACGAAALLGGALDAGDVMPERASDLLSSMPDGAAKRYVADEISWRMEEA
ncbi:MAG: DNA alkylation repair protein [Alistipes sp.]|nr:DNA alkylation repair protein [Alistipes sp.]